MKNSTSLFAHGMIWFGAAISIAEILTGTYIAELGLKTGLLSIILGHLIGCALLYFAGLMGARLKMSAMDTAKYSFGQKGTYFFAALNVFQLVGWTAIMINQGAEVANALFPIGTHWWSIVLGALIIIWILPGLKNLKWLNTVVMGALFISTLILSIKLFKDINPVIPTNNMSFGSALELSIAMPLSWLPVISDYTMNSNNAKKTTLVSVITYFVASSWMYIIGFFSAMFTGAYDIVKILEALGIGVLGIIIVLASTTTTTFLDALSAGISAKSIKVSLNAKTIGIITTVIGVLLSILANSMLSDIEGFLYIIANVFAPMIAIMVADFFILKKDYSSKKIYIQNFIIWLIGFILYRLAGIIDADSGYRFPLVLGYTLPVFIITLLLKISAEKIKEMLKNE